MKQMGYTQPEGWAKSKTPRGEKYKAPDGRTVELSYKQIKDTVMTGARNYQEAPKAVADAHFAKWARK